MFTRGDGPTALRADLVRGLSFSNGPQEIRTDDRAEQAVAGVASVWNGSRGFVAVLFRFIDPPRVERYMTSEPLADDSALASAQAAALEFARSRGFRMDDPEFAGLAEDLRAKRLHNWNLIRKVREPAKQPAAAASVAAAGVEAPVAAAAPVREAAPEQAAGYTQPIGADAVEVLDLEPVQVEGAKPDPEAPLLSIDAEGDTITLDSVVLAPAQAELPVLRDAAASVEPLVAAAEAVSPEGKSPAAEADVFDFSDVMESSSPGAAGAKASAAESDAFDFSDVVQSDRPGGPRAESPAPEPSLPDFSDVVESESRGAEPGSAEPSLLDFADVVVPEGSEGASVLPSTDEPAVLGISDMIESTGSEESSDDSSIREPDLLAFGEEADSAEDAGIEAPMGERILEFADTEAIEEPLELVGEPPAVGDPMLGGYEAGGAVLGKVELVRKRGEDRRPLSALGRLLSFF